MFAAQIYTRPFPRDRECELNAVHEGVRVLLHWTCLMPAISNNQGQ